jgi:hypothetical protein
MGGFGAHRAVPRRQNTLATINKPRQRAPTTLAVRPGTLEPLRSVPHAKSDTTWHASCCYCPARTAGSVLPTAERDHAKGLRVRKQVTNGLRNLARIS